MIVRSNFATLTCVAATSWPGFTRVQGHADATSVYNRAIAVLGSNHAEVIMAAINAGEYEKAARALNLGNMAAGDRDAHARAVRRTFFGQVTDLRWTSHRSNVGAATVAVTIEGEATHGNQLWQPFVVQMVREGVEWKLRSITVLGSCLEMKRCSARRRTLGPRFRANRGTRRP